MDKILEEKLIPLAGKLGSQRHLASIRDGFIAILPITLLGSVAVLLNVFLRDIPTSMGNEAFVETMAPIININGIIWWGSLAIMTLLFTVTFSYNLAKNSGVDPLPATAVGLAAFVTTIPQSVPAEVTGGDPIWGFIGSGYIGATGLFTSMFAVIVTLEIYTFLIKRNFTIKMPENVPPAVANAFLAVIPALISVYTMAIISDIVFRMTELPLNDLISQIILMPLLNLSQGLPAVIIITVLTQLLWFVGLHGMNILTPVYESIWGVAQIANMEAVQTGAEIPYLWVRGSFDVYGMFGGSGGTLALVTGMLIFGKRKETKVLGKIAIGPGIFNINEPIVFGLPIILNPIYFVPWVFVPVITITIGYICTIMGITDPVIAAVPWVTPVGLMAFLATGGDIMAALVSIAMFILAFFMWMPFIIAGEKAAYKAENKQG